MAVVDVSGVGFFEHVEVDVDFQYLVFARNAFVVYDVELGLFERRCDFVFYDLDVCFGVDDFVVFLD